jgi:WD40 repeat protein/DNA-binding SARP family transcriptional activator
MHPHLLLWFQNPQEVLAGWIEAADDGHGRATVIRHLSLVGRIAVRTGDVVVDERALPGRQPRLAFSLLVAERHRHVSREELADNLWPNRRPETWESALRSVISRVRGFVVASGLGARELLQAESGGYRFHLLTDVEVDLERAATLLDAAEVALAADDASVAVHDAARARGVLAQPLLPGTDGPWVEATRREIEQRLLRCLEVLAEGRSVVGDHAHAVAAADAAIVLDPFRESAHRGLMRALLRAGDGAAALCAYERCRLLLAHELGADPSPATQRLHLQLLGGSPDPLSVAVAAAPPGSVRGSNRLRAGSGAPTGTDVCPYRGLQTFDEADAPWFFGRSADVSRLLDRLERHRFLAVLGVSGSGKSSLVRAGLLPALRDGALPGSDTWTIRVVRPGAVPMTTLIDDWDAKADEGWEGPRLLLVVDQLEEIFTLCRDVEQRRTFLSALAEAVTAPDGHIAVVVTLRTDFYHRLTDHPTFADLASAQQYLVTPMDEVGLAQAIESPAHAAGLECESGLTATMLRDVARRPGSLPLLQHALLEVWQCRVGDHLTLEGYRASGGVEGAIAQRAQAIYTGLSPDQRAVARRLLLRLTRPGAGAEDVRRTVAFSELVTHPQQQEAVEYVVESLSAARLLTIGSAGDGDRSVEVSHEALIRSWPRLYGWIDEDRAGLVVHRRLTEAAADWERLGRDDGALYRGVHLDEALAWAERRDGSTNALERDFLASSVAARRAARRRRGRRMRFTVTSLVMGLLLTTTLSMFAIAQSQRLGAEARAGTARELAAAAVANLDVDPERSILLALEAVDVTRALDSSVVRDAEEALHRAVKRSRVTDHVPRGGYALALSPDGTRIASTGADGRDDTVSVWQAETGREVLRLEGHDGIVHAVAFSPDGRWLATAGDDGSMRLWDATSGSSRLTLVHGHAVRDVAFSPDGGRVAANDGADIVIREVTTGKVETRLRGHTAPIASLAFSPDGTRLVSGGLDTTGRIWDLDTGSPALTLAGHEWAVMETTFSPDGRRTVTASIDGTVRTWDALTGEQQLRLSGTSPLDAVAFSPDGQRIAAGGTDGTVRLWESESGRQRLTLAGHTSHAVGLAFSPDGDALFSSSLDRTTRSWDVSLAGGRDVLTAPSAAGRYAGVSFSPDGTRFAVLRDGTGVTVRATDAGEALQTLEGHDAWLVDLTFDDKGRSLAGTAASGGTAASDRGGDTVPVWDLDTGELRVTLEGHDGLVAGAAFSPDGRRLVTGGHDGTVKVWDAVTGEQQDTFELAEPALAVSFDAEGWTAVSGDDGRVTVWDDGSAEPRTRLHGHARTVHAVEFGPGGMLVTGDHAGLAVVWDGTSGRVLATLQHSGPIAQIGVSADGRRVATTGDDGTVRIWDPMTGEESLTLFGHEMGAFGVAFSPDGRLLATTSPDGTVALHLLAIDEFVNVARERLTRGLTAEECRRYVRLASCPAAAGR